MDGAGWGWRSAGICGRVRASPGGAGAALSYASRVMMCGSGGGSGGRGGRGGQQNEAVGTTKGWALANGTEGLRVVRMRTKRLRC